MICVGFMRLFWAEIGKTFDYVKDDEYVLMQELHHQTNGVRYGHNQHPEWERFWTLYPEQVSDASHREMQRIVYLDWKWREEEGKESGKEL